MPTFINRVGHTYSALRVLSHAGKTRHHNWFCVCTCGTFCVIDGCDLATGNTRSCGCAWAKTVVKHGAWNTRSYHTWRGMLRRCTNPADKDYAQYGGAGIRVQAAWADYLIFLRDMGEPPKGHTLDRKDPYGDYTPENCRWATFTIQARNIRVPRRNTTGHVGVTHTADGWRAHITVARRKISTRVFASLTEAVAARMQLETQHWRA